MKKAQDGKFVSVHYTGTLDNGEVFDSSQGRQPLEFEMGGGNLIEGFENAVRDMNVDESKKFTLHPSEAYGDRDETLLRSFSRSDLPADMKPEEGQTVVLHSQQGQQIPARISQVGEDQITVDLNHPLAGESLTFDVKVVEINDAPAQPQGGCSASCDGSQGCSC